MKKLYLGIDPGLHGAVAAITSARFVGVWDTPTIVVKGRKNRTHYLPSSMVEILKNLAQDYSIQLVTLELVRAMPGQGVVSMFSMGMGVGLWEGIIAGLGLRSEHVTPQQWKKAMLGGVGNKADKAASLVKAARLFPLAAEHLSRKRDEGRAEALLIAAFGRHSMS